MKRINLLFFAILLASTFASAAPLPSTGWFSDFVKINVNGAGTAAPTGWYWIGSDPSYATQLQGATLGTVSSLVIEGCDMKYWSNTQDRTGGSFFYRIMTSDGLTEVVAPVETIWDHVALGGNDYQGTKASTINVLSSLNPGTTYQLQVYAKSWGTGQGDSWLSNSSANYVATFTTPAVIVTGAAGIVDGTGYTTLKAAFDAINLLPDQTGKDIEIKIGTNITETATALLSQPATAAWNSLTIYPTATATIEGAFVGTIIDLSGADKVTINGKLNKIGAAKTLTISHTSNADNGNRTIRFINDAKENTIQYCTITGKCPSNGAGVIFLSTALATTGTGNDNNIIEYCDINAMGEAAVGIGSAGTADKANSGNILRNNNIFDFYLGATSTTVTYGINIGANNTAWTISGNSFYQTASRSYNATTNAFHYILFVSAATGNGVDFVITDNYIGGSAPLASGTPWTITSGQGRPIGIYTSVGTASATSVQNNTVANFDITTSFVTNGLSAFIGYWHNAGTVNVGTVTGNTIGTTTGTGSIVVKFNSAAAGALTVGINIVTGAAATMVFSNNKIGGIIADYLGTVNRGHLYAVSTSGAGALTFTNNTIGSTTVANSIEHKGSTYTGGQVNLRGITMGNIGITLTGNTIANLKATSTASMSVSGVFSNGTGSNNYSNNIIRDIKSDGTRVIAIQGIDAGLVGIISNSNSTTNTISGNTIYNLENTNTTLATDVYGINIHNTHASSAGTVSSNKIYNLITASTNTAANVVGISITRGLTNTNNNMISLGNGITNAVAIAGIRKLGTVATQNNNFYHNTVVISGSEVGAAGASSTSAFVRTYTATDEVKNNIFINTRSNATGNTQKHYAVNLNATTTLTEDNNILYVSGTGGLTGVIATTDYAAIGDWQAVPSLDAASKSVNVNFVDGLTADLRITGASEHDDHLAVAQLASVTTDKFGTARAAYTYAGAHEGAMPFYWTSLTTPEVSAKILNTNSGIEVVLDNAATIELYNINGLLIEKTIANGSYTRNLAQGAYIIRINGKATKFIK
ncbi:MAG: beta strand repeat-containing protein [Bacteroidia bacterium]